MKSTRKRIKKDQEDLEPENKFNFNEGDESRHHKLLEEVEQRGTYEGKSLSDLERVGLMLFNFVPRQFCMSK